MVTRASVYVALDVSFERAIPGPVAAVEAVVAHAFFGDKFKTHRDGTRDEVRTCPEAMGLLTHLARFCF